MLPRHTFEERFWEKVEKRGADDCWMWSAAKDRNGYGATWRNGLIVSAHRAAWELRFGPISGRLAVLHRCDTPRCVNPNHLFLGTQQQNLADMRKKGRDQKPPVNSLRGSDNGASKLTREQISEIRALTGKLSQRKIAAQFGISPGHVCRIQKGQRWSDASA